MFGHRTDREILLHIEKEIMKMALNFSALQAAVSQLSTDVGALVVAAQSTTPADQGTIDAVTASLAALDAAVKAAETPATPPAAAPAATAPTGAAPTA